MNKYLSILVGLVLLLAPIYAWIVDFVGFGEAAKIFFMGGLVWLLILIGVVMLFSGISELKE